MEYKYKAFISYRHLEPDMQAAERLQKLLESYKPPKNLGKTKDNWRIFRDVSELQSSSDLSEDIKNAIETSEYLIVICSPKYTESKWCMQELTRFRELHGNTNQNIITLLVSGEPQEAFPEELTYTEMTTTNEQGEEVRVKVEVEPLAANIKADTLKESMKKLNTEYLRIAAPLLGCDFNDLFQREKRRETARRRRIFGGVSGILSLITVISVASAVTISRKNVQIQEQNDQIKEQNSQIREQNEQIEQKNNDLLIENAGHLAVESENLYKESSLIPAIQKAVAALPAEGEDKPVLPEAEYALSRELGMFKHSQLVPQLSLRHECAVEQLSFMGGGKTIVSQDATGVYFWDAETGSLLKKLTAAESEFASASGKADTLSVYLDVSRDKTGTYFDQTSAPSSITYEVSPVFNKVYTNFVHAVDEEEPGTGGDVYIYNADSTVWRLDGATGDVKWKAAASGNAHTYLDVIFDEQHVLRLYQNANAMAGGIALPGSDISLEVIDRETGTITADVKLNDPSISSFGFLINYRVLSVRDGVVYIYCSDDNQIRAYEIQDDAVSLRDTLDVEGEANGIHTVEMQFIGDEPVVVSGNVLAFRTTASLSRYDSELKEKRWTATLPVNYQTGGDLFLIPAESSGSAHDVLAVTTGLSLSFIDYETGDVIANLPLDSAVVDVSYSRNGLVMFITGSGAEYAASLRHFDTGDVSDNAVYRVQTMNTALSLCSYSRGRYVTADNYSNTAYIQYVKQNPMYTEIDTGEFMYDRDVAAVSESGGLAAVTSTFYPEGKYQNGAELTRHLFLYDTAGGTCSEVTALTDYQINSAAFLGEDMLIVNATPKNDSGSYFGGDVTACISPDLSAKITDAPHANNQNVKLMPTDDGVFYLCDSDRDIVFVTADGTWKQWAAKEDAGELIDGLCAVRDHRAACLAQLHTGDGGTALLVYDFAGGQQVTLDCDADAETGRSVQRIFWQNDDTVGVFFGDRTVRLFDAASGEQTAEVSLVGTSQEPISAAPTGENTFAVLCRDSCLYEMDANGFTGRSCRLDFSSEDQNSIRGSDSSDAALLGIQPCADGAHGFVTWDGAQAWLLDTEAFTVRYRVDHFAAAPAAGTTVFTRDTKRSTMGFFPIYTTQQLLTAAKEYLSALGEE